MKVKLFQAIIIGLIAALGLYLRPQIAEALSLSVVGWGEDNSVSTNMMVDGSITTAKIANLASESSRLQTWSSSASYNIDMTSSDNGSLTIDPSISVTVPTNKAYYYWIKYEGNFNYLYSERKYSLTKFNADLWITPLSGTTSIGDSFAGAVRTGRYYSWSALGDNEFWTAPFHASWVVRLTEGTHNIKFRNDLWSSDSMSYGHLERQRVQVMRIL